VEFFFEASGKNKIIDSGEDTEDKKKKIWNLLLFLILGGVFYIKIDRHKRRLGGRHIYDGESRKLSTSLILLMDIRYYDAEGVY